ncbi:MAG: integrase core domain-containing protein [Saprospiraceae bacterium]|nr:integrase core domain-containing protein [Saprospiraceae bacterium]MCF8249740.1 integrase core domain-containing protein [Saprospiraceae bacterium]MCF8279225.1 integrase core domain-containing protein [Bacteroidales bacterium]MCF8312773.1 integrase core domain-containing protein [Saprospiraceae bacterium]MCF8441220.1 integrase core domain-containing protein [Saprospiraceae bacterium]
MKQEIHSNAKTNVHFRSLIHNSNLSNNQLSEKYAVSKNTICKWKNRINFEDKSSRPHSIQYSLSEVEQALTVHIRTTTWWALDDIVEMVFPTDPNSMRSSVYRTFVRNEINKVPQKEKDKAKKFKEYEPGFLHIDVTYLPKINGIKYYLFVAIDRATRTLYYKVYDAKTSENAEEFMNECIAFFPFGITHVLTDNGLEFTNKLIKSKKGHYCPKPSKLDAICSQNNIDHRLTKPGTPKTNGMVERVNGTIKNNTIKKYNYENIAQINNDLMRFVVFYNLYRRHSGLRKELNVKTPYDAIKKWFEIKPEIFLQKPFDFKNKILNLTRIKQGTKQQPCET